MSDDPATQVAAFGSFTSAIDYANTQLKNYGVMTDSGHWQGVTTDGKPDLMTKEILDMGFAVDLERASWHMPTEDYAEWVDELASEIEPNLPWANMEFEERVGGAPKNPHDSLTSWPWWHGQTDETMNPEGQFTHTYSERFWPTPNKGVRFRMGNYDDVLDLLFQHPNTRQAYLPIFFPEDTGAKHSGRVPCTLGYHFLLRSSHLHCWYEIRSCDAVRHFRDDLYLAARLVGHTIETLFEREVHSDREQVWVDVDPGMLLFRAHSFHVHMGDYHLL